MARAAVMAYQTRVRERAARLQERAEEQRQSRMEHGYAVSKKWEEAAKAYYGHNVVDAEYNHRTGLYRTTVGSGNPSPWMRESTILHATEHMWAALHERELNNGNVPD
jgi:hypothetical protein